MKFVSIPVLEKDGNTKDLKVNPIHVVMLVELPIPSGLTGPGGEPIVKPGTGLLLSNGNVLPTKLTEDNIQDMLEST